MQFQLEEFQSFSKSITGFNPYKYQEQVAKCLLEGKNVILSVPTGAGKTWASIIPFLYAKNRDIHFPKKMIYSLPLRALCNSISQDVSEVIDKKGFEGLSAIQTGEFSDDKYFEKDIIFSTIDQTLSNFLCFPLALSQRQANINAGALIGSYLVFDEFHLLDSKLSMATTLGTLKMLDNLSRFCIMTATLSDEFMDKIKAALPNTEIITLKDFQEDKKNIKSLIKKTDKTCKKEIIVVKKEKINAANIITHHKDKTIVICNRVETAQRLYLELEDWAKRENKNLVCLHSRFFDRDRKTYEKQLKELFGKNKKDVKTNAILIATQVIEAGMDISCETMHSEIAPINALLQRAGRCARYAEEYGQIFVYDILSVEEKAKMEESDFEGLSDLDKKEIKKLRNLYLPYDELLCKATLAEIGKVQPLSLSEEVTTRLVNDILTGEEQNILNQLETNGYNLEAIQHAWRDCSKSNYRKTIRDIQSLNIVIISDTKEIKRLPYAFQHISIFKWSLVKWIKEAFEENATILADFEADEWLVGTLQESQIISDDREEGEVKLSFCYITDIEDVKEAFDTLFLNAKYFHYDKKVGFNKAKKGNEISPRKDWDKKAKEIFAYRKDTFVQHTKALLGAFEQDFLPNLSFPFKAFTKLFETEIDFKRLLRLVLALHDYGKLDNKWQAWMQKYQSALTQMPENLSMPNGKKMFTFEEGLALGHTGCDTKEEKEQIDELLVNKTKAIETQIRQKRGKRPPHSGVGAKMIIDILEDWGEKESIIAPASVAIARHHGVANLSYPNFQTSTHNYQFMQQLLSDTQGLEEVELNTKIRRDGQLSVLEVTNFETYLLYLFLVRILRLCDQKATDDFEKYISES